jgi:hypothetical protein
MSRALRREARRAERDVVDIINLAVATSANERTTYQKEIMLEKTMTEFNWILTLLKSSLLLALIM